MSSRSLGRRGCGAPAARGSGPRTLCPLLAIVPSLVGCGDALDGDRPSEVRVQRAITAAGDRVISYTAMFDDGIETYIDLQPAGDADLITIERDSRNGGSMLRLVREGAEAQLPADGPAPGAVDEQWQARFRAIDAMVDKSRVPWSDAHGLLMPGGFSGGGDASPAASPDRGP